MQIAQAWQTWVNALLPALIVFPAIYLLADRIPLPVLGAVGVLALWAVAARSPAASFALIFAAAPFYYDITGGSVKVAACDLMLVAAFPIYLLTSGRMRFSPSPIGVSIIVVALTYTVLLLAGGADFVDVKPYIQMLMYIVICPFIFGFVVKRPEDLYVALWAYVAGVSIIAAVIIFTGQNYVLGLHKNACGTVLSVGVLIAFSSALKLAHSPGAIFRWAIVAMLSLALLLTASRGAWVGTLLGLVLTLVLYRRVLLALRVAVVAVPLLAIAWSFMPEERRDYATDFDTKAWNVAQRYKAVDFGLSQFAASPLTGQGLRMRDAYDATNLAVLTLAEAGVIGAIVMSAMFTTIGISVWRMSYRIRPGHPCFSLLVTGSAVMLSKLSHGMFDHYWGRGLTIPWAGAGFLIFCWNTAMRDPPPKYSSIRRVGPSPLDRSSTMPARPVDPSLE